MLRSEVRGRFNVRQTASRNFASSIELRCSLFLRQRNANHVKLDIVLTSDSTMHHNRVNSLVA